MARTDYGDEVKAAVMAALLEGHSHPRGSEEALRGFYLGSA